MWLHPGWMREQCRAGRKLVNTTTHRNCCVCLSTTKRERERARVLYKHVDFYIYPYTHMENRLVQSPAGLSMRFFRCCGLFFLVFFFKFDFGYFLFGWYYHYWMPYGSLDKVVISHLLWHVNRLCLPKTNELGFVVFLDKTPDMLRHSDILQRGQSLVPT